MSDDLGRAPSGSGSRPAGQAPTGLDRPGFDPSRGAAYSTDDIAEMFFNIANECMDCIDPATDPRSVKDFRRIAGRAAESGYKFYRGRR